MSLNKISSLTPKKEWMKINCKEITTEDLTVTGYSGVISVDTINANKVTATDYYTNNGAYIAGQTLIVDNAGKFNLGYQDTKAAQIYQSTDTPLINSGITVPMSQEGYMSNYFSKNGDSIHVYLSGTYEISFDVITRKSIGVTNVSYSIGLTPGGSTLWTSVASFQAYEVGLDVFKASHTTAIITLAGGTDVSLNADFINGGSSTITVDFRSLMIKKIA